LCLSIAAGCTKPPLPNPSSNPSNKEERSAKIRKSTVRIYVDGKPKGTGFVIAENGLIATAFHVVAKIASTPHKQSLITYASSLKVQFEDGERLPAIVHKSCIGKGLHRSILSDFAILEIKTSKKLIPLRLGNFNDIYEGAGVYLSGNPLVSDRPWISFGTVSVKWKDPVVAYHAQLFPEKRNNTEIALLDIPMNRGDSGGPIMIIGDTTEEDRVVGIASFTMTPLDQELKALVKAINNYTDGRYNEVCTIELFQLLRKDLGCKSLFIPGCISIDPLKLRLQQITNVKEDQGPLKKFIPFL
jgi:S1-C subfamily serine protease